MKQVNVLLVIVALLVSSTPAAAGALIQTVNFSDRDLSFRKMDGYDVVDLAGYPATTVVGAPRLPQLVQAMSIPAGATVTDVEIISAEERELEGAYNIIPAQRPVPLPMPGRVFKPEPPQPNQAIYSHDGLYPTDAIQSLTTGSMCGYRIGHVVINPVRYNPVTKKLYFTDHITYRVRYDENKIGSFIPTQYQKDLFGQQVRDLVANPLQVDLFAPMVSGEAASKTLLAGDYHSVTISGSTSFDTVFARLGAWKTKKGTRDTVVNVNYIYSSYTGYDNIEKIRNFIIDAKNTWGTVFVLLAGQGDDLNPGENLIPARHVWYTIQDTSSSDTIPSDLYYSDLDGTWDANGNHVWGEITDSVDMYPDVFVGRAPVLTVAQAQNFVAKTLNYEKNNPGGYLKKMLLPTAILWDYYEERPIQRAIAAMTPAGWVDDSLFERNGTLSRAAMVASMNDGRGMGHWVGHGNESGIYMEGGPFYNFSDANAATNGDKQGIAISIACMTGGMDLVPGGDCFAEHIINRAGGGCVGVMMNSRYGWGGSSEWIDTTFFHKIFINGVYRQGQALSLTKSAWVPVAVAEGYHGRTRWCIYDLNLFGDPELPLYTDEPAILTVGHAATVQIGPSNYLVTVNDSLAKAPVYGALVCAMTENKDSYVYDTTDASGQVTLHPSPTVAGQNMYVTVTARNHDPYEGSATVIVPATVTIVPDTVTVNSPTTVTVTVTDPGSGNPMPDIQVTVDGFGVNPALVDTTDGTGEANFNITALYGELLPVTGRKIGDGFDMFRDTIWAIGAADFGSASIAAKVASLGLTDTLTPDYEATFNGSCDQSGFTMYLEGCGISASGNAAGDTLQMSATPTSLGTVSAALGKAGYNIYQKNFICRDVYGTLSGTITEQGSGNPMAGVAVRGWKSGADTAATAASFSMATNALGTYTAPNPLLVGQYDLYASKFGYIDVVVTPLVVYGPNTCDFSMQTTSLGSVSGTVTEAGTGIPLKATINVYRSDDGSLYASVTTDSAAGGTYSISAIPYFNYSFKVTAYHHRKVTRAVTVNSPLQTENFALEFKQGDILVINDHDSKGEARQKAVGKDRHGNLIYETLTSSKEAILGESATQIATMLAELGYSVTQEQAAAGNPATWSSYDAVIWSDGMDITPLSAAAYRNNLKNYVKAGGKLLLEGGEIGFNVLCYGSVDTAFADTVLHASSWLNDYGGALTLKQAGHSLATTPNSLPASLLISYSDFGDQDAVTPTADAKVVYGTTVFPAGGGIIAYDNDGDPTNGQIVYYAFNFKVLSDIATREQLLENTVEYLIKPSAAPGSTLSGQALLSGQSDHSGIVVSAWIGISPIYDTTDASGNYSLGVYDMTYAVTGSKAGYVDTATVRNVTVLGSATADFVLYPVITSYQSDFEADNGNLTGTGDWQWGAPTSGPNAAYSGSKLWATNLAGNYVDNSNSTLTLPAISNLPVSAKLEFRHWHIFEAYGSTLYDGGNVKVSTNGGSTWTVITPEDGYTGTADAGTPGVGGQQIFGGSSGGWAKKVFDLAAYGGQDVLIRMNFGSDGAVTYPGWYVDNMRVYAVDFTGVTSRPEAAVAVPSTYILNHAWPNPFTDKVQINFGLPKSTKAALTVYNIAGQKVATLADGQFRAGYHTVVWNGRSANGLKVSGGLYFYRLVTPEYSKTGKIGIVR